MKILKFCLGWLELINAVMIRIGKSVAWICVAAMVLCILLQVFCRYVLNNALPWPEEAARALMIWMMALVAANAYRQGSFVAIDMLHGFLPPRATAVLKFFLLLISALVLIQLFSLGLEFFQRGFRTRAASFNLSRAWIYLAMPVCFGSMLLVNAELLLREVGRLFGRKDEFPAPELDASSLPEAE
ncbi:TRAP transporter small permease [Marinobacterium rhizophilum]|uniref:TRAP transporter small permease n=1 Tax=Marinobacterium rhizophilum TaxID=420402 RepID=UPI00036DEA89|nr:TRAP transporter small permease [Marinobacterium rhizophilum]